MRLKQELQSHCEIFRQMGVEIIDRTYNKWF